jgi:hypothetical protein
MTSSDFVSTSSDLVRDEVRSPMFVTSSDLVSPVGDEDEETNSEAAQRTNSEGVQ